MRLFTIILASLFVAACTTRSPNKFSDETLTKIYDLKDRQSTDSLLVFLRSPNAAYRQEAALAFGSVQDSTASVALGTLLLEDPDQGVKINAAFALGQTGGFQAANALIPALAEKNPKVVREVLEALGKTVHKQDLNVLIAFHTSDTLLQEGLAWAFYYLALRKMADSLVTNRISSFLFPDHSFQTRLAAAHYFSRSTRVDGQDFRDNLISAALHDGRPEVRMAAASGLRHLDMAEALPVLKIIYQSDPDYRVRISAVRVCQKFPSDQASEICFAGLRDSVEMVQVAASEVLRNAVDKDLFKQMSTGIDETVSLRAKANLFAALLKSGQQGGMVDDVLKLATTAPAYFKTALFSALGETKSPGDKKAFEFLSAELTNQANEKVVLTSAASAVVSMDMMASGGISKKDFLRVYELAIAQGDVAVIGVICSALTNKLLHYRDEIKDVQFLHDAKAKFTLPKDIESLQPLEEAIAYLEGKEKPRAIKNEFNHPIDWKLVKVISTIQKAEVTTTKGRIVIRLLVEETPGSVANFVDLVNRKYFDGKYFHRVVPNFVIQTGCNRGDGYGSEDYSIRSEFSRSRYATGSVGMASAGKDTEGTQWFITHSPTPHLNGKYTLFAQLESGMEVVHRMEVGDKILEVRLKNE